MAARASRIPQLIDQTVQRARECLRDGSLSDYEELNRAVHALAHEAREAVQALIEERYAGIAGKLENGRELTEGEREALELLIVGEAEHYLKTENNREDWKAELSRLTAELGEARARGAGGLPELMHVQALCRDARGVLPEMILYRQERERIDRFRDALRGPIGYEDGRFLARLVRDLFASDRR